MDNMLNILKQIENAISEKGIEVVGYGVGLSEPSADISVIIDDREYLLNIVPVNAEEK